MANKNLNPDIAYQPKTQQYSFSTTPEEKKKTKKIMSTFFALFFGIPFIILLFFIFFVILNYFNTINLSSISSTLNFLPKKVSEREKTNKEINEANINLIPGTNTYSVEDAILKRFNDDSISISLKNGTSFLLYYNTQTRFYLSNNKKSSSDSSASSVIDSTIAFKENVINSNNIGRTIYVRYRLEKDKKILEEITLVNN